MAAQAEDARDTGRPSQHGAGDGDQPSPGPAAVTMLLGCLTPTGIARMVDAPN